MGGRHYQDMLPYLQRLHLGDVEIPFLSAEGLIVLKGESLRERVQADVAALRALAPRNR